jgi:hypothetical protein
MKLPITKSVRKVVPTPVTVVDKLVAETFVLTSGAVVVPVKGVVKVRLKLLLTVRIL